MAIKLQRGWVAHPHRDGLSSLLRICCLFQQRGSPVLLSVSYRIYCLIEKMHDPHVEFQLCHLPLWRTKGEGKKGRQRAMTLPLSLSTHAW